MERKTGEEWRRCAARTQRAIGNTAIVPCNFVDQFDKPCELLVSMNNGQPVRTSRDGTRYTTCRHDAELITAVEYHATGNPDDRRRSRFDDMI